MCENFTRFYRRWICQHRSNELDARERIFIYLFWLMVSQNMTREIITIVCGCRQNTKRWVSDAIGDRLCAFLSLSLSPSRLAPARDIFPSRFFFPFSQYNPRLPSRSSCLVFLNTLTLSSGSARGASSDSSLRTVYPFMQVQPCRFSLFCCDNLN